MGNRRKGEGRTASSCLHHSIPQASAVQQERTFQLERVPLLGKGGWGGQQQMPQPFGAPHKTSVSPHPEMYRGSQE